MAVLTEFTLRRRACGAAFLVFLLSGEFLPARSVPQENSSQPPPTVQTQTPGTQARNAPEISTRDSSTTFKVRVNLVLVRVVVRDPRGKVVENLRKEDFRLFDNRKPQTISSFSVETPASHVVPVTTISGAGDTAAPETNAAVQAALPRRFVALLFDDIHLSMEDAVTSRAAASRIFDALGPSDRVGIFTTSGQFALEFTGDKDLLRKAMLSIVPRNIGGGAPHDCPDVSYYMADLIENTNDLQALAVATEDAIQCAFNGDHSQAFQARLLAVAAAARALSLGDGQTEYAYRHFEDVLRRLTALPGQRTVVFISPGFIVSSLYPQLAAIIDRATRANVTLDTLDARGLYAPEILGDIADPPVDSPATRGIKSSYRVNSQRANEDVLRDFAYGTGGTYFHNRNDLDVALREAIAAPSVSYLLAFSPQNLKLDGSYHTLTVKLAAKNGHNVQARRGYYAPRTRKDPAEQAREEIQEAAFSQEEIHDIPVELQTQFFKKDEAQTRLSVVARVDVKSLPFQKADGRNRDNLTLATLIFDENGNFVIGGEKILEMRLFDSTLDRVQRSGITVKSSFDVKPGTYLVRLVVRDTQGEQMAARNGAVVIPY